MYFHLSRISRAAGLVLAALVVFTGNVFAGQARQIEEVVVTAERQEASVQDTSISITAFTGEMLEDFGIRNQTDLQNLTPATTIQPYDATVRGVGRNFRALGGDPGVATYMNNIYSEDLYTATIGSLWDLERVEILRGPQGTLYGRNAVGGAMNFLYKEPSDEVEGSLKVIAGSYDTLDYYGVVSGPLIEDQLFGRFTYSKREHDGWVEERGPGDDLDSGDEQNIAVQLRWNPTDTIQLKLRSNLSFVDRVFGGSNGGGLVVIRGETFDGLQRDYTNLLFGYRRVDPAQTNAELSDFQDPTLPTFTFNDPRTGAPVLAQNLRPGIDSPGADGRPNQGFGLTRDPTECVFTDKDDIDGDDLCAITQGLNVEVFEQQGNQFEAEWDVSDRLTLKYLYGFNDLLYERITDDDSVDSLARDRQFYVNHEAEYVSHEIQAFWQLTDTLSFTTGIFYYDAIIHQRGDLYSAVSEPQYLNDNDELGLSAAFFGGRPKVTLFQARTAAQGQGGTVSVATGVWSGDDEGNQIVHGPDTEATDLEYTTQTERDAYAVYNQGVWDINDQFTLTFGIRWARDDVHGQENLFRYTEAAALPNDRTLSPIGLSLADVNVLRGALDPTTLQPTGNAVVYTSGVPFSLSVFRQFHRSDDKVTGRINLDWEPNDDSLVYFGITTGYRSGGFNLVFFSQTGEYDPEELTAYELGYKGQHFDNTLQINASVYYYDYETIHTVGTEVSLAGGTSLSVLEAPGAEIFGFEADVLWLATENLTLGGNISFTPSEYTEDLFLADGGDIRFPSTLFPALDRTQNINGNQLLQVPEHKGAIWASWTQHLDNLGRIDLLGTFSWIDDVYYSPFETEFDQAPGYERLDLRATWTSQQENWVVSAYVNNVLDEIGIRQILRHGEEDGFRRTAQTTEPRHYGVELTWKFGAY